MVAKKMAIIVADIWGMTFGQSLHHPLRGLFQEGKANHKRLFQNYIQIYS
jgi:hypothetical protein